VAHQLWEWVPNSKDFVMKLDDRVTNQPFSILSLFISFRETLFPLLK
jgi:hypothetical protein